MGDTVGTSVGVAFTVSVGVSVGETVAVAVGNAVGIPVGDAVGVPDCSLSPFNTSFILFFSTLLPLFDIIIIL